MPEPLKEATLSKENKPTKTGSSFMQAMQDDSFMEDMKDSAGSVNKYEEMLEQLDREEQAAAEQAAAAPAKPEKPKKAEKPAEPAKQKEPKKLTRRERKALADQIAPDPESASEVSQRLKRSRRRREKQLVVIIPVIAVCLLLNFIAWHSEGFSRTYMEDFFPYISLPYTWIMDRLSFSFGELLIEIGLWIVAISTPIFIILMILKRKSADFKKTLKRIYGYFYAWVITFVLLTETLNCFILYHTPTFAQLYDYPGEKYTPAQLEQLCDYMIAETNAAAKEVKRDKEGRFVLTADIDETDKASMKKLGNDYAQLRGYYTKPKPIRHSFFMSQQYMMGIYFPFTMEANYNAEMPEVNLPDTVCHELANTKGFMREDEANFIGFLACDASKSADYRYSGYLRAMKYVISQCEENCSEETVARLYGSLSDEVLTDWNTNIEHWKQV
ncbi:MAG: DUF3810 domain-containing protein, partial [Ruminococcus sp.]|nr:DUF3810 domain-containing protein [Ruminococcus sp.]